MLNMEKSDCIPEVRINMVEQEDSELTSSHRHTKTTIAFGTTLSDLKTRTAFLQLRRQRRGKKSH